jgi:Protein of unknown function (DUF3307)
MTVLVKLLALHFLADFILQPREMGVKKSQELKWLFGHLAIQFLIFAPFTSIVFALANCAVHGVIDWYIWRAYKLSVRARLYDEDGDKLPKNYVELKIKPCHSLMSDAGEWRFWLDHLFYTTIGLDQMLHGITLVLLAEWLLK